MREVQTNGKTPLRFSVGCQNKYKSQILFGGFLWLKKAVQQKNGTVKVKNAVCAINRQRAL